MRKVEVSIIGGGIVGLCCAFYLSKAGFNNLIVLERGKIADEASYNNMGGLWPNHMSRPDMTKPFADLSLSLYEEMASNEGFNFEFRRNGVLELISDNGRVDEIEKDIQERRTSGYDVRFLGPVEISYLEPNLSRNFAGGIFCPRDANGNSFLLAKEFQRYLTNQGHAIIEGAEVDSMLVEGDKIVEVQSTRGSFESRFVINASGPWSPLLGDLLGHLIPVEPAKGFMLETGPQEKLLSTAVTNDHIVVTQRPAGQIRTGGVVEFAGFDRTFHNEKKKAIWNEACSILPKLAEFPIAEERTGFRPHSKDGLPIIGYSSQIENLIIATGHFRRGFELGAATGKVVSELIQNGNTSMDISFASPGRFGL